MAVLIAAGAHGARLGPAAVAEALARGLQRGGLARPEVLALAAEQPAPGELDELLQRERFDARLHGARALLIAPRELSERALPHSAAFELATRARQAGVPAYAIVAHSSLGAFDARLLDLQLIVCARGAGALARAAEQLAGLLLDGEARPPARASSAGSRGTRR